MTTAAALTLGDAPKPLPAWFWPWAAWLDSGKKGLRPASAPRLIPPWAWVRYKLHRGQLHQSVPVPLQNVPGRIMWARPGLLVSDINTTAGPEWLCGHAAYSGYERIAVQLNGMNEPFLDRMRTAAQEFKLALGVWDDIFTTQRTVEAHLERARPWAPAFDLLDIEGSTVAASWASDYRRAEPSLYAAALISGGDTPIAPWVAGGFAIMPQCYMQDEPVHNRPLEQDWYWRRQGAPGTVPCLGVYHGYWLGNYHGQVVDQNGLRSVPWVYFADQFKDADWQVDVRTL